MADLLLDDATIVTMNPRREVMERGAIAIEGQHIVEVGKSEEIARRHKSARVINAKGKVILPGFVNAHTHGIHNLLRGGLSVDRSLYDWLWNVLWPGVIAYKQEHAEIAASLFCLEAISSGITTVVDNADWGCLDELSEPTIRTYEKLGIRAIYARMIFDTIYPELDEFIKIVEAQHPEIIHVSDRGMGVEDTQSAMKSVENLMDKFHGQAGGRIRVWPSPGITHYTTKESMLKSRELAEKFDAMCSIHVAESRYDKEIYGVSSVEYLDRIGFLCERVLAGHCVHVNDRDIRIMKLRDVKVAHNAVSNMYLASGIAPIPRMIAAGITVGLGTDDCNCNNSVNMFADMKTTALLHKVANLDAAAITAEKILEMATIDGARAVGLEKEIGSIEPDKKADLILIDMDLPQLTPCHNIPGTLVYQACGKEVNTAIVDGKIVMENHMFPAIEKQYGGIANLLLKAQEASNEVIERARMERIRDRPWKTISN